MNNRWVMGMLGTAFVAFAAGCAGADEVTSEATDEAALAAKKTIVIERCEDVGITPFDVGKKLTIDAPSDFPLAEVLSIGRDFAPEVRERAGARGRRLYTLDTSGPEEYFVRLGRIQFLKEVGAGSTEAKSCDFEGKKAGWKWVRASDWTGGGDRYAPPREMDRDLGEIPLGGGLLVEGYPFSTNDAIRTWIVPVRGAVEPVRTTRFDDYGAGTYVFRPTEPGEFTFDMRVLAAGYIDSHNHVRFRVR